MTEQEIIRTVNTALAEEFELDQDEMRPETHLYEDLDLDSLDAVDMVIVLEEAFGIKIGKDEAIKEIRTLGDLYAYILGRKKILEEEAGGGQG